MSIPEPTPRPPQANLGKAYEYALAAAISRITGASLAGSSQLQTASANFDRASASNQISMARSAERAVSFLVSSDIHLEGSGLVVGLQTDQQGQAGDVRDILLTNPVTGRQLGISAKHRHSALKHSRLSATIDFGQDWIGMPASADYFRQVHPLFMELEEMRDEGMKWRDVANKANRFYVPLLDAFEAEVSRLTKRDEAEVAQGMLRYLLGRYDFYKVIKVNGTTRLQSFNLYGTLGWGPRLRLPSEISRVIRKPRSTTTTHIEFNQGWQVSLRIHSAETLVIPSLKFDINLIGQPGNLATNTFYHMRD